MTEQPLRAGPIKPPPATSIYGDLDGMSALSVIDVHRAPFQ